MAVAQGTVKDLQGEKYAHGTSTIKIIKLGVLAT
jgi:hypothetical protein